MVHPVPAPVVRRLGGLALAAIVGGLAGAATHVVLADAEPQAWIRPQLDELTRENLALRREIGRLRVEFAESLQRAPADSAKATASPARGHER